jgi:SAM-dependent methyltransferase
MTQHATSYQPDQYADNYPTGIEQHWWVKARCEIIRKSVTALPAARVLDVGCGPGLVVAHLRQHGIDCWGCELGVPDVREGARDFVRTGTDAQELEPELRQSVGIILLLDVLEHLPDPRTFLFNLIGAYPALHGIIATVPARMELWTAWDDRYGHFLRYDRCRLTELYNGSGIDITWMRYIFQSVYPALFLASRMRTRGTSIKAPRSLWPHTILAKWFVLESSVPGLGAVPGSSLIAVGVPRRKRVEQA